MKHINIKTLIPALALAAPVALATPAFAAEDEFFDQFLTTDGKFPILSVAPTTENEAYTILELPSILYNITVDYSTCNDTWTNCVFQYRVWDQETMTFTEDHSEAFDIDYSYNEDAKPLVDELVESVELPEGGFTMHDLELLNYRLSTFESTEAVGIANFSSEVHNAFANTNLDFAIDLRCGANLPLATENCGIGKVSYGGSLYHIYPFLRVNANHIFYVPAGTDEADFVDALQTRIDDALGDTGEFTVTVEASEDTVATVDPEYAQSGYEFELAGDEPVYYISLAKGEAGDSFPVLIREAEADDELFTFSGLSSTDLMTGVNITTEDLLPGDTRTYAFDFAGAKDEDITSVLGTEEYNIFSIGLFSNAMESEITDGNFTVSLPVPESLAGKQLSAYWINYETGEAEEFPATLSADGTTATYETTHFSTYVLAESSASDSEEESEAKAPNSGLFTRGSDGAVAALPLSSVILAGAYLLLKKR